MAFLFDRSALSVAMSKHRLAHHPRFEAWLRTLPRSEQFTCATVIGELRFGARKNTAHTSRLLARIDELTHHLTVVSYDLSTADRYSVIRAALAAQGVLIDEADLQIAACALEHRCTIVTANLKHFTCVPGLQVRAVE